MRTLIITEKPSVARDFAVALGARRHPGGWLEGPNVVITWAVGHLLELFEPHDYDPKWRKWGFATLPIRPADFRYKPIPGTAKQLELVQSLVKDSGFDRLVIATDAGREGEVIARTVLLSADFSDFNRAYRFWTSQALTPAVVRDGLDQLQPAAAYDRLWHAGQARQIADWLVGINGSRGASLRLGDLFSVGRVQTAVLALLVDRLRERESFEPVPYWLLRAGFKHDRGQWWGTWFGPDGNRIATQSEAEQLAERLRGQPAAVVELKKQVRRQPPPPLFSLTDLQRAANQKYGFSAKQTLDLAQTLYEQKKCLSYPRTDSRVLGSKNVELVAGIVAALSPNYPDWFAGIDPALIAASNKRVFNDARLTDHHALIPLAPLPGGCTSEQEKIYRLVTRRFAAAFHPDHQFEQTDIITQVLEERFRTTGKRVLKPGWQAVYEVDEKADKDSDEPAESGLPQLQRGDRAVTEACTTQRKMTKPSPAYTDALLLQDMTNPARYVEEKALKQVYRGDVGLGTQATRAQIIETLLQRRYARREQKLLLATAKGCQLIDTLRRMPTAGRLTSPEATARWEQQLDEISRGQGARDSFLSEIQSFVGRLVDELRQTPLGAGVVPEFGRCPWCGAAVIEGRKGYGCSNWRKRDGQCRFVVWKEYEGCQVTPEAVRRLLKQGQTGPLSCGAASAAEASTRGRLRLVKNSTGERQVVFEPGRPD